MSSTVLLLSVSASGLAGQLYYEPGLGTGAAALILSSAYARFLQTASICHL